MLTIPFGLYQTHPKPFNRPILLVVAIPLLQWMVMHRLFGAVLMVVRRARFEMTLHPAPLSPTSCHPLAICRGTCRKRASPPQWSYWSQMH